MGDAIDRLEQAAWRERVPLNVNIELTRKCNLGCDHCYVDHHIKDELTLPMLEAMFVDIARAGCLFLTFTGGEVGLRKDLHEIIAAARRHRFNVKLLSTATLFDEEDVARLASARVRQVKMSIYSDDPAVHDKVVRRPGALAKSLAAAKRLLAAGVDVIFACPVMQENQHHIARVALLAESLGVRAEFDPRVNPMEDGSKEPCALRISAGALAASFATEPWLGEYLFKGGDAWENGGLLPPRDPDSPVCSAGNTLAFIDSRGEVYPCTWWRERVGNAVTDGFYNLWTTAPVFKRIREQFTFSALKECGDCGLQRHCTVCPGVGYQERGDARLAGSSVCNAAAATKLYFDEVRHGRSSADPGFIAHGNPAAMKRVRLTVL